YSLFSPFFFNASPTTDPYTLSLHDPLPITPSHKFPSPCSKARRSVPARRPVFRGIFAPRRPPLAKTFSSHWLRRAPHRQARLPALPQTTSQPKSHPPASSPRGRAEVARPSRASSASGQLA